MVINVIHKTWRIVKVTTDTARGMVVVLFSPNKPIPPTKMHPRMPPMPYTPGEWLRMFQWRHNWTRVKIFRDGFLAVVTYVLIMAYLIVPLPRQKEVWSDVKHMVHHAECFDAGRHQKEQDALYFAKYDPLRNVRAELAQRGSH